MRWSVRVSDQARTRQPRTESFIPARNLEPSVESSYAADGTQGGDDDDDDDSGECALRRAHHHLPRLYTREYFGPDANVTGITPRYIASPSINVSFTSNSSNGIVFGILFLSFSSSSCRAP